MNRTNSFLIAGSVALATLASVSFSTPADARRLRVPGVVFRLVAAPLQIIASRVRGSAHRYRYVALAPALAAGGAQALSNSDIAGASIARGRGVYWTYSFNELIDDVLQPSDGKHYVSASELCASPAGGTTPAKQEADATVDELGKVLQPTVAQRSTLEDFHQAWIRALDELASSCTSAKTSAAPAERLAATADYLSAMWRAAIHVHAPLETFYKSLNDEQKARLNGVAAQAASERSVGAGKTAQAASPTWRACAETARIIPDWPAGRIEQQIGASAEQRASLAALRMTSTKMQEFIAGSCPYEAPPTPLGRLSAEENQLLTMSFAVQAISQPLAHFYDSLSEPQQTRFAASLQ